MDKRAGFAIRAFPSYYLLGVAMALAFLTGCAHNLQIKNLDAFSTGSSAPLEQRKRVALIVNTTSHEKTLFIEDGIKDCMRDYADDVLIHGKRNKTASDVVADISLESQHSGSGWNFLITWPGFFIFTPAWNGYVYKIQHDFDIKLRDPETNKELDAFKVPVELDIRHADFDRTFWSDGMGWFFWTIPALVAAPFHCSYDPDVTPLAAREALSPVGKYVTKKIIDHINELPPVAAKTVMEAPRTAPPASAALPVPVASFTTPAMTTPAPTQISAATGLWLADGSLAYTQSRQQRAPLLVFAYADGVDQQLTEQYDRVVSDPKVAEYAKGWLVLAKVNLKPQSSGEDAQKFARQLIQNNTVDKFPLVLVLNGGYKADYTFTAADLHADGKAFLAVLKRIKERGI